MQAQKTENQLEQEKQGAARAALRWVRDGMTLGLGSGTTSDYFISFLGELVRKGLKVRAIASSTASEARARKVGIPVIAPHRGLRFDLTVDGADEIAPDLGLMKGRGGALLREKILAGASRYYLVIADSSKRVTRLGSMPVPVEVIPFALPWVTDRIEELGGKTALRMDHTAPNQPFLTDQQNYLLECHFAAIEDPRGLAMRLDEIPGVAGHGLFLGYARAALIAEGGRVVVLCPGQDAVQAEDFDDLPDCPKYAVGGGE
jgi:ribose 5-phosphate isomerase A